MKLCGCNACLEARNIKTIKDLYSMKEVDDQANYFSRQLIGLHAVYQHRKLCERIADYGDLESFSRDYPSQLNKGLLQIYKQL